MTALNGLLQLQAEVRRQQVSQGAGPVAAWGESRRAGSLALFDKELQRQQRTNYETRSAAEIRPDQASARPALSIAFAIWRKRQEDLNRRQRELAAPNLSPEEMKRQLEKLTREQTGCASRQRSCFGDRAGVDAAEPPGQQIGIARSREQFDRPAMRTPRCRRPDAVGDERSSPRLSWRGRTERRAGGQPAAATGAPALGRRSSAILRRPVAT